MMFTLQQVEIFMSIPKMKCSELIKALLQITMDTDDTTDSDNAPIVPSWNLSPSPIFVFATTPSWQKQNPKNSQISKKKKVK